jgi:hypothetical protein
MIDNEPNSSQSAFNSDWSNEWRKERNKCKQLNYDYLDKKHAS